MFIVSDYAKKSPPPHFKICQAVGYEYLLCKTLSFRYINQLEFYQSQYMTQLNDMKEVCVMIIHIVRPVL